MTHRLILLFAAIALGGCHYIRSIGLAGSCHSPQEYQRAQQVAPIRVPPGLDNPNTQGALTIPDANSNIPPRGPNQPCLEEPPKFQPPPPLRPAPAS
jgi:uncharacterized lipoprotein